MPVEDAAADEGEAEAWDADVGEVCAVPDRDGDRFASPECGGSDCDDDDPAIYPGAPDNTGRWWVETIEPGLNSPVIAVGPGAVHLAWPRWLEGGSTEVVYARDEGTGWMIETVGADGGGPALNLDDAGRPRLAYIDGDSVSGGVRYAEPTAGGWRVEDVPGSRGAWAVSSSSDDLGSPHLAFAIWNDGHLALFHAERAATGWSVEPVDSTPDSGYGAKILAGSGDPLRIFYERRGGADYGIFVAEAAVGSWTTSRVGDFLGDGAVSAARDSAGAIHLWNVWQGDAGPYATNAGGVWTFERPPEAGPGSLVVDRANRPRVAFAEPGGDFTSLPMVGVREAGAWSIEQIPYGVDARDLAIAVEESGCVHVVFAHGWVVHATDCDPPPPDGIDQDCDGHDG